MNKLPAITTLAAVALAAAGFLGGVLVQKHQSGGTGGGTAGTARAAGPPSGGATNGAGTATTGTVTAIADDGTISLKTADGTTVKVKTTKNARVTRNARTSASEVHPGDAVTVQGTTASDGTVTAGSLSASSATG
jgi:Domain of unknown function (DUF5666)